MPDIETLEQQIAKQQERLKQLKAQKQAIIAREKAKQNKQERANDTRRKILIGSCMLKLTESDQEAYKRLMTQLDKYLTEQRDRALFGL